MLGIFWMIFWFAIAAAFGLREHPIDVLFIVFDLVPSLVLITIGFLLRRKEGRGE
jgi:hypothetical protein